MVGTGAWVWTSDSRVCVRSRADPGSWGGKEHKEPLSSSWL
jgi:hypothetical protein